MRSFSILLDEWVDRRLSREFANHSIKAVPQVGLAGLKNGELLSNAQHQFDVFLTTDKNLSFQNTIVQFDIAVIVLRAKSNRINDLRPLVPSVFTILDSPISGTVSFVSR